MWLSPVWLSDVGDGVDGGDLLKRSPALETVYFDYEYEFRHPDPALLAIHGDLQSLQGLGYAFGRAAGRQDIIQDGDSQLSVLDSARRDVRFPEVKGVGAILLYDCYLLDVVALGRKFALLAEGNDVCHAALHCQKR